MNQITCRQCQSVLPLIEGMFFCPCCRLPLKKICDRYTCFSDLASGGCGLLYLAKSDESEESFVIKLLKPELFLQKRAPQRFLQEAQLTAQLSQKEPHFVRVFDFGEDPDLGYFYAMEYLQGEQLRQVIEKTPQSISSILFLFQQLCDALHTAHQLGIIHRDLKPENILLLTKETPKPFVKVLDLGIAKSLREASAYSMTTGLLGTPAYMSPEQCQHLPTDARTDIYALGLLLYEMLTKTQVFSARDGFRNAPLFDHIHREPDALSIRRPDLSYPQGLNEALQRALEKDPAQRYASAEAFWQAISVFSDDASWISLPPKQERPRHHAPADTLL